MQGIMGRAKEVFPCAFAFLKLFLDPFSPKMSPARSHAPLTSRSPCSRVLLCDIRMTALLDGLKCNCMAPQAAQSMLDLI